MHSHTRRKLTRGEWHRVRRSILVAINPPASEPPRDVLMTSDKDLNWKMLSGTRAERFACAYCGDSILPSIGRSTALLRLETGPGELRSKTEHLCCGFAFVSLQVGSWSIRCL